MAGFDSTLNGQRVVDAVEKAETLNATFVETDDSADEPETPEWKLYVDDKIGDINSILDNINGEKA
jgi:hypothetical protein